MIRKKDLGCIPTIGLIKFPRHKYTFCPFESMVSTAPIEAKFATRPMIIDVHFKQVRSIKGDPQP